MAIGIRHLVHRAFRNAVFPGPVRVALLHAGNDAVENIPLVPVVPVQRAFRDAEGPGDHADGNGFISVPCKQAQRRKQDLFFRVTHERRPFPKK